jgi:hypothetical protein
MSQYDIKCDKKCIINKICSHSHGDVHSGAYGGVEIHFNYNPTTGAFDDFKFK